MHPALAQIIAYLRHCPDRTHSHVSGRVLSRLTEQDLTEFRPQFPHSSIVEIAYCLAFHIEPPVCKGCQVAKVRLINTRKGFRPFCSSGCANRTHNRIHNGQKNQRRAMALNAQYHEPLLQATQTYLQPDSILSIPETAKQYQIPPSTLQKHLFANQLVRQDKKRGSRHRFQVLHPELLNPSFFQAQHDLQQTTKEVATRLGVAPNTVAVAARALKVPFPSNSTSHFERDIAELFRSRSIEVHLNTRSMIPPMEIDVYLPAYRLGIEFNGDYWHHEGQGKDKYYHLRKQEAAESQGIHLIQIFEHEWVTRRAALEQYLLSRVGFATRLGGRDTQVQELTAQEGRDFFQQHHVHGHAGASTSLGLFYQGRCVSAISLRRPRFTTSSDMELIRFCNQSGFRVQGGLSKLLSAAQGQLGFTRLISYAHRRLFEGSVYLAAGFTHLRNTPPGYWWFSPQQHEIKTRYQTQKHKLPVSAITESAYMHGQGYFRAWDCGQRVFIKEFQL